MTSTQHSLSLGARGGAQCELLLSPCLWSVFTAARCPRAQHLGPGMGAFGTRPDGGQREDGIETDPAHVRPCGRRLRVGRGAEQGIGGGRPGAPSEDRESAQARTPFPGPSYAQRPPRLHTQGGRGRTDWHSPKRAEPSPASGLAGLRWGRRSG